MPEKNSIVEAHPLEPFLPPGATVLLLGSFPPPRPRWSMEWFYPNLQNDMWRIMGIVFFEDRYYFMDHDHKKFEKERIERFVASRGIALSDTARIVRREKGNASDQHLTILETLDLEKLLLAAPDIRHIATTGGKSAETLAQITDTPAPATGIGGSGAIVGGRAVTISRLPSTSRAYPKPLEEKAAVYADFFRFAGLL